MGRINPFVDDERADEEDRALVEQAKAGRREALERLVERHQPWVYNLALRMIWHPQDAEDVTQEVFIKVLTKLTTFQGRSRFRTWLYRIVVNHVLNMKRGRLESPTMTFEEFGRSLDRTPDLDLPDRSSVPADVQLLVDEARIGCTLGMLLCLDREQRLIYILGEVFGVGDVVGAELVETTRANFRQKLSRARRDLHQFMNDRCGLVNRANPCRCAKKTRGFMQAGWIDPQSLLFATAHVRTVREVAVKASEQLSALDEAHAEVYRAHPFPEPRDLVPQLRAILRRPEFRTPIDFS